MGGRDGWGLSPLGWGLAYATAAVEFGTIVGLWRPLAQLGVVRLPPSAVPGFLLLGVLGARLFSGGRCWVPFVCWAGALAAVPALCYRDLFGGVAGLTGFVLAALQEEVVYRAALPLVVWRLLVRRGGDPAWSTAGALVIPAALFAVLPNHLRQAVAPLGVLPFFTFALFLGLLVRRPSVLLPAALTHLTVNLLTVPVTHGAVSPLPRTLAVAALLGGFAVIALWPTEPAPAAGTSPPGDPQPLPRPVPGG